MRYRLVLKRLAYTGLAVGGGTVLTAYLYPKYASRRQGVPQVLAAAQTQAPLSAPLPTRAQVLSSLSQDEFDVLVIGGGATGAGVALDSVNRGLWHLSCAPLDSGMFLLASGTVYRLLEDEMCVIICGRVCQILAKGRWFTVVTLPSFNKFLPSYKGLKTALVEKFDFGSGTSSRSTKLIHGGVRYLQKAVFNLDIDQYRMVKEALTERGNLIDIAPHLAYPFPIMLPIYRWWQVPYFWAGIKMYDLVAGRQILKPSYYINKTKALELFPMLKKDKLVGALVYYDGQHDDARMNLSIAITAARMGGSLANHTEVLSLLKRINEEGVEVVSGARCRDMLTGKGFEIKAKCVINATGPYTDSIRQMSDPQKKKICQPSSGVHVVLPDYYSPERMGLLDPSTSDGRVIFFLPWQRVTLAGTTDNACEVSDFPQPSENEIQFILNEVRNYLHPDIEVRRGDVLSAWSGIRPLVSDPAKGDTQSIARNHIIEVAEDHLITIAGGKWTTYRHMAEETMDRAISVCGLSPPKDGNTIGLLLDGAHGWTPTLFIRLVQDFGLENEVAQHLANTYGDKAFKVAKLASLTGKRWPVVGRRIHDEYPYLEAEIRYAVREYACSAVDVLARRTRLAFINVHAAEESLPRVVEILAEELGWSKAQQKEEIAHCKRFLRREMGLDLKSASQNVPINFNKDEINQYVKRFQSLDSDKKGYITVNDLRKYFKKIGERVTEDQLHDILNEVDLNKNAQVDMGEFLQLLQVMRQRQERLAKYADDEDEMMSAMESGTLSNSRFVIATKLIEKDAIPVERSGGGV